MKVILQFADHLVTLQHTSEDTTLCTVNTDAQAQLETTETTGVAAVMPVSGRDSMAQTNYEQCNHRKPMQSTSHAVNYCRQQFSSIGICLEDESRYMFDVCILFDRT